MKEAFWNILDKGENASNQHFLFFSQSEFQFLSHTYFVICELFQFWQIENSVVWKRLSF